jgi:hypothetical protein
MAMVKSHLAVGFMPGRRRGFHRPLRRLDGVAKPFRRRRGHLGGQNLLARSAAILWAVSFLAK